MRSTAFGKICLLPLAPNICYEFTMEKLIPQEPNVDALDLLREIYPELNHDQLIEAKERLDGYFDVVLETFLESGAKANIDDHPAKS